jgi:integrase
MTRTTKARRRGTITPKGEGKWLVRVSQGRHPVTGQWLRLAKLVLGSRRDAEQVLTGLLGNQDHGIPLPMTKQTLHAWLEEYEATWSGGLAPQTRENQAQALRTGLPAPLLAKKLASLTARDFQELYNVLSARGLKPRTVGFLHRVLRARLNKAVELGKLSRNPTLATDPPKISRREYRVLSPDEARVFLEEVDGDRFGALWTLLLLTGLRPGEALGLRWEDLEGDRLTIRRALVRLRKGAWGLEPPKTGNGRTVTLPAPALRALTRHRARQAETKLLLGTEYTAHGGLVFAATFGQPLLWANVVRRHFIPILARTAVRLAGLEVPEALPKGAPRAVRHARALDRAAVEAKALDQTGLARMRPYDLRHSAATLLLASGEHPKIVSELLGHAKVTLTLDTYSHVSPAMLDQAARRMEAIVGTKAPAVRSG